MRTDNTDTKTTELLDRARPAYGDSSRERALSAMARAHAERPPRSTARRTRWIPRVAAAAAVVALGLGFLVLPGRFAADNARNILAGVAQAMEQAASLHQSGRTGTQQGLVPGRFDSWFGARAIANRYYDRDTGVLLAGRADLDARRWWFYDSRTGTRYVADLTPVMAEASRAVPRLIKHFVDGKFEEAASRYDWPDARTAVTTGTRAGRRVKIVTIDRSLDLPENQPPIHVTDRYVYEVDASSHHLLATRRHWVHEDGTEVLLEDVDVIEYDVPVVGEEELLASAEGVRSVSAMAPLVHERGGTFLVLMADGERLLEGSAFTTMEVPGRE